MLNVEDIEKARDVTRGHIRETPLEPSSAMSEVTGADVYLKLENLQVTGSFKARGSFNRLLAMSVEERKRGVVAATAGNHGVGLSYAGMRLGIPVHVHISEHADPDKLRLLRRHGAVLHFAHSYNEAHINGIAMAKSSGLPFISAYNDPWVVASDGVVGLEILEVLESVDLVIVPVGGGGLLAGIALAAQGRVPGLELWGVEAAVSPTISTWFRERKVVPVEQHDSVADGLAGHVDPDTLTWPIIRDRVTRMTVAGESELINAMRWMVAEHRLIIEPSAASGIAAVLKAGPELKGRRVAVVVSGGNVAWSRFLQLVETTG
jgi:threonine dehydratase